MKDLRADLQPIWQTVSGEAAWQAVADLSRFHRIQASPGYRRAAGYIHRRLVRAGLESEILAYPADERTRFWAWSSFQEWDCAGATLRLVAPEKDAGLLADFRACPTSLIQRSHAFEGEAKVVLLEDGEEEEDYAGKDVAGKIVLTRGNVQRVWELAVAERAAVGILFDGMRTVPPVRVEGDLADARQYTSFWWQAGDTPCFGFVLTPRQGRHLRRLLERGEEPVQVHAWVDGQLYDGQMEVVSATIPGEIDEEVLVVTHLCHPQPSANDNASGAAALLEAARTLQALIHDGKLSPPRRTIRFLWVPEINGTVAYLAGREETLGRIVSGLNLDMVGEDQDQTGSSWLIERPPDPAASFASDLLVRLRQEMIGLEDMADVSPGHTGAARYPLFRQAEVPFSGGSDHLILSDPTVGVPTPMIGQWPDRFYHTSADTPDRTDPQSLARAGTLAAAYVYWLAAAAAEEATWLGYQMVARFKGQAVEAAQGAVTRAVTEETGEGLAEQVEALDRRLAYLLARHKEALAHLDRLAPTQCMIDELQAEAEESARRELHWAKDAVDLRATQLGLKLVPSGFTQKTPAEEGAAGQQIPIRNVQGPVPLGDQLRRLDKEDRENWRKLVKEREAWRVGTMTFLALCWADGQRSVHDIAGLVEMEVGVRDVELLQRYFELLEKLGHVELA